MIDSAKLQARVVGTTHPPASRIGAQIACRLPSRAVPVATVAERSSEEVPSSY
jgi:hypothetical protein